MPSFSFDGEAIEARGSASEVKAIEREAWHRSLIFFFRFELQILLEKGFFDKQGQQLVLLSQ